VFQLSNVSWQVVYVTRFAMFCFRSINAACWFDYDFCYRKTYVFTCCVPVNTNSLTQLGKTKKLLFTCSISFTNLTYSCLRLLLLNSLLSASRQSRSFHPFDRTPPSFHTTRRTSCHRYRTSWANPPSTFPRCSSQDIAVLRR